MAKKGKEKKKTLKRIGVYFLSLLCFYILAAIIYPVDDDNTLVLPNWYYYVMAFVPIIIAVFYDKLHIKKIINAIRKSRANAKEQKKYDSAPEAEKWKKERQPSVKSTDGRLSADCLQLGEFPKLERTLHTESITKPKPTTSIFDDPSKTLEEKNAAYLAIRDEEERKLNAAYDFNSIEGINSIPVPCVEVNGGSPTGRVEYYLRGKCFYRYEQERNEELAIACLKKAQELMFVSDMIWKRYDFLRLVEYLYKIGRWEEAETELARIDKFFGVKKKEPPFHIRNAIQNARNSGTDLIEAHTSSPYCSECAKYTDRIYSISGRDRRFPKLPKKFTDDSTGHYLSCLQLYPYFDGISEPSFICKNIYDYSNRPYKDERTQEDVDRYNNWKETITNYSDSQEAIEWGMLERAKLYYEDMQLFKWLQENLPTLCPKSLTGFRRMRTMNTKNYQKIVVEAAKLGKEI